MVNGGLKVTARVGVHQRVIEAVGVAVVALGVEWACYVPIGAEEPLQIRIVQPTVHVDQPEARHTLVAGVAPVEPRLHGVEVDQRIGDPEGELLRFFKERAHEFSKNNWICAVRGLPFSSDEVANFAQPRHTNLAKTIEFVRLGDRCLVTTKLRCANLRRAET